MITIEINHKQLKRLKDAVSRAGKKLPRELSAAVNAVAKKSRRHIGKQIRDTINLKKDVAERPIKIKSTATPEKISATVTVQYEAQLGLQYFGAKQNKTGVSYKIPKRGGRTLVKGAFMGPRPGVLAPRLNGGVFIRVGASRLPIRKLRGVSPYGAFRQNNMTEAEVKSINDDLRKEMERRINLNILRAEGLVKA